MYKNTPLFTEMLAFSIDLKSFIVILQLYLASSIIIGITNKFERDLKHKQDHFIAKNGKVYVRFS